MFKILVMKTEMATGATIKAVEGFDKTGLKQAETTEKNPLPDKEGRLNYRRYNTNFLTNLIYCTLEK